MQVFKVFFKVLNKYKHTMIIYIVIYLSITLAVSRSLPLMNNGQTEFSKVSLEIGVKNQDQGELGEALVSYLEQNNKIKEVPADRAALQDAMYYQEIDYVLVIPQDFSEKFAAGKGENLLEGTVVPGSSSAFLIENEIQQYLNTAAMYLEAGVEMERTILLTAEDMQQKPQVEFQKESDSQPLPGAFYFFQYIPYVFLVLMILGLGAVMKTFKGKDLTARNKCSALSFFQQNIQMILGCVVFTLGVYLIFMGMACLVDREYLFSVQGFLSAANALVFSICAVSIAWFCVQFVRNMAELNIMSNVFSLSFSFLGGVFVSLELMSDGVQKVAKFIPSYWYVIANREIQNVTKLSEAGSVYQSFLVVLVFALAFFAAGLLANRMKLKAV